MNLLLVGFVVAVCGGVRSDYIGPTDWEECEARETLPKTLLSSVQTFMDQGFEMTSNVDCSSENRAKLATALEEMYDVCRDSASFNISLWNIVYNYICDHQQGFIEAAPCMASQIVDTARQNCNVGLQYYAVEENCRSAPICVGQYLTESQQCTADDAMLFQKMTANEASS